MKRLTRRQALGLLGTSAAAAALPGCCARKYPVLAPNAATASLAAAPVELVPWDTRKHALAPRRCIDVHAHFFNASDVPVRDYLGKSIAHDLPDWQRRLAEAAAPLADLFAAIAPSAAKELDDLNRQQFSLAGKSLRDKQGMLDSEADAEMARTSDELAGALRNTEFERIWRESKARELGLTTASPGSLVLDPARIRQATEAGARPRSDDALTAELTARGDYPDGVVAFLVHMCSARRVTLHRYRKAYTTDANAFGIDTVLGALVDFDYWLHCAPVSSHEEQIELQARLSRTVNGYMRPLVGYNPMTDVKLKGAALKRVVDAMNRPEFVGVKVYPPNGFLPAGNGDAEVEKALEVFFKTCADRDIPVMAHSAESRGRNDIEDKYGGPPGWEKRLSQYSTAHQVPIVNVGHFGGTPPKDDPQNEWTQKFAELMSTPGGARLYGDLGFWDELNYCDTNPVACKAAVDRIEAALQANGGVARDRIMYGSDWFMFSLERHWSEYPQRVSRALQGKVDADKFFGGNALSCFARLGP